MLQRCGHSKSAGAPSCTITKDNQGYFRNSLRLQQLGQKSDYQFETCHKSLPQKSVTRSRGNLQQQQCPYRHSVEEACKQEVPKTPKTSWCQVPPSTSCYSTCNRYILHLKLCLPDKLWIVMEHTCDLDILNIHRAQEQTVHANSATQGQVSHKQCQAWAGNFVTHHGHSTSSLGTAFRNLWAVGCCTQLWLGFPRQCKACEQAVSANLLLVRPSATQFVKHQLPRK